MSVETLRSISERLREMYRFGRDEQITTGVNISQDEYYVDLGVFGESSLSIELEDDEYYLDAEEILDKYPIETSEFDNLADELDEFIGEYEQQQAEDDIEVVLKRIEANGGAPLVAAIRQVIASFQGDIVSVGPLPEKPLPWPGALRPEIDYTAADFPFRYDPPPGFTWARDNYEDGPGAPPEEANTVQANTITTNEMVLDKVGRVFWYLRDEKDDFSDGMRWRVWHNARDVPGVGKVPEAQSFSIDTPPRALSPDGKIIREDTTEGKTYGEPDYNWQTDADAKVAYKVIADIRAKAPQAVMVEGVITQTNEYGVTYDPLTIPTVGEARRLTEELRVGDDVGGYGRVLTVERDGTEFFITFSAGNTDRRESYNWYIKTIENYAKYPTALSISEGKKQGVPLDFAKVTYDPLTVEVGEDEDTVQSSELRLGDDITGPEFGRVINVAPTETGGFTITMNRNGSINVQQTAFDEFWSVLPVVGVDRLSQPTAASLGEGVVTSDTPAYDPLTVEVSGSASIRAQDLRVGDLVTGSSFGRVITVVEDPNNPDYAILTMNYEGKINTVTGYKLDQTWGTQKIVGVNRDLLPTAFSLSKGAPRPSRATTSSASRSVRRSTASGSTRCASVTS